MTTYRAIARRWEQGWELHVEGIGITQVKRLDAADRQVRDFIETMEDVDASRAILEIEVDLGGLEREVALARRDIDQALQSQRAAAGRSRQVARALRARGLSVADTATIMAVSPGRVSQLAKTHQA